MKTESELYHDRTQTRMEEDEPLLFPSSQKVIEAPEFPEEKNSWWFAGVQVILSFIISSTILLVVNSLSLC